MERIICDSFDKEQAPVWKFDADSLKTKEFNRKIKAVNDMYAWLYGKGILEKISFEFKDYSDSTYFAFDVNDLKPYRTAMENCDVEDAALAVQNIFDAEYTPCLYSGAIELTWPMITYREFDGTTERSWECGLCKHMNSVGVLDVEAVRKTQGVKAAVKLAFELSEFEPSDLDKSISHDTQSGLDEQIGEAKTVCDETGGPRSAQPEKGAIDKVR